MTAELVRYNAMCSAIAECHRVDEVKDIRDKARALEMCWRQARNTDAERKPSEIRLRAERRAGELLKELARADHNRNPRGRAGKEESTSNDATQILQSPYAEALAHNGISRQTASRYQALANVPEPLFEEALRDPVVKPSTARMIQEARDPVPQIPRDSLWIWGRARDFERDGFIGKHPAALMEGMTEGMQADMRRIVPMLAAFYQRFAEIIADESA